MRKTTTTATALLAGATLVALAAPASADEHEATVSVLHGVPVSSAVYYRRFVIEELVA